MSSGSEHVDALRDHFGRAWDMVIEATEIFTDAGWTTAESPRFIPARLVYHVMFAADRYTYIGDPERFLEVRTYSLNWLEAPLENLPSRGECLEHLAAMKARTGEWLEHHGEAGLKQPAMWSWTGDSMLDQALYYLRHTQYHMAELNMALRQQGLAPVVWK